MRRGARSSRTTHSIQHDSDYTPLAFSAKPKVKRHYVPLLYLKRFALDRDAARQIRVAIPNWDPFIPSARECKDFRVNAGGQGRGTRPSKAIAKWFSAAGQFLIGRVHVADRRVIAR